MRGSRLGTCFLEVVHYIPLPVPEKAIHKGASERPNAEVFRLTEQCIQRMLSQGEGRMETNIHDAILMTVGSDPPKDYPCRSAFQVPVGISQPLFVKQWCTLAVSPTSKWDLDSDVLDLLERIRKYAKTLDASNSSMTFIADATSPVAASVYALLARDLESWSGCICASVENPEDTRDQIHRYVLTQGMKATAGRLYHPTPGKLAVQSMAASVTTSSCKRLDSTGQLFCWSASCSA